MNLRFLSLVGFSAGFHYLVIFTATLHLLGLPGCEIDQPAKTGVVHGEVSVTCVLNTPVPPRPLSKAEPVAAPKKQTPPPPEKKQEKPALEKPVPPVPQKKSQPKKEQPPEPVRKPESVPKVTEQPKPAKPEPVAIDEPRLPKPAPVKIPPSTPMPQGVRTEAHLRGNSQPKYPPEAQLRGMEGEVTLALDISAEGRVIHVELRGSSGYPILDEDAQRFVLSLQFEPARQGGVAVGSNRTQTFRYRLTD